MSSLYKISIHREHNQPLVRGQGNVWPISGSITGDLKSITGVELKINNHLVSPNELFELKHEIENIDFFRTTLLPNCYHFCHFISSKKFPDDQLQISIVIKTSKECYEYPFLSQKIIPEIEVPPATIAPAKVAICMATYNPDPALFKRQVDSIINQTESDWRLVINDDGSNTEIFEHIKSVASTDNRISVFSNDENLGFYYNFEACLNRIHYQFEYIALADQDDEWYPTKLQILLQEINSNQLIYNDMEIIGTDNSIISESFWKHRTNHYTNLSALFLANTVTGSASLFKSSLLSKILPLPSRIGNAFHDHWIGLVAASSNGLKYLDEVQQSYIQHGNNVTGYGRFKEIRLIKSTLSFLSLQRMKTVVSWDREQEKQMKFVKNNIKVYFDAYLRRKLQYAIIIERFPDGRRKSLDRIFGNRNKAIQHLLLLHWKVYKNDWMTNNAELSYVNALEVMKKFSVKFKPGIEKK